MHHTSIHQRSDSSEPAPAAQCSGCAVVLRPHLGQWQELLGARFAEEAAAEAAVLPSLVAAATAKAQAQAVTMLTRHGCTRLQGILLKASEHCRQAVWLSLGTHVSLNLEAAHTTHNTRINHFAWTTLLTGMHAAPTCSEWW